jgi:hypothetical protein
MYHVSKVSESSIPFEYVSRPYARRIHGVNRKIWIAPCPRWRSKSQIREARYLTVKVTTSSEQAASVYQDCSSVEMSCSALQRSQYLNGYEICT